MPPGKAGFIPQHGKMVRPFSQGAGRTVEPVYFQKAEEDKQHGYHCRTHPLLLQDAPCCSYEGCAIEQDVCGLFQVECQSVEPGADEMPACFYVASAAESPLFGRLWPFADHLTVGMQRNGGVRGCAVSVD